MGVGLLRPETTMGTVENRQGCPADAREAGAGQFEFLPGLACLAPGQDPSPQNPVVFSDTL